MSWSGLIKFLTGFVLAIALLLVTGVGATRYLITRLSTPPPRPVFENDDPNEVRPSSTPAAVNASANNTPPANLAQPTPPPPAPDRPGAYEARVVEPIGLVLRQGPSRETERIGGLDYNQQVTVLETSSDGEWTRVRLSGSGVEGWVKAGNTERTN